MARIDVVEEFRNDHRKVRDGLLEIIKALRLKDVSRAGSILSRLNVMVGPHFRFEEEFLYPSLREFLGEYVDQLVREHDGVIKTAAGCAELLRKGSLTDDEAGQAADAARALLVHVSNCDGLAILTERLSARDLARLGARLQAARKAGVPLLEWAETIRGKAPPDRARRFWREHCSRGRAASAEHGQRQAAADSRKNRPSATKPYGEEVPLPKFVGKRPASEVLEAAV